MEYQNLDELTFTHHENRQKLPLRDFLPKVPKSALSVKPETIYKHLLLNTNQSDSSKVNPNKYGTLGHDLKPVSSIFCDNIILCAILPVEKTETVDGFRKVKGTLLKDLRAIIRTWLSKNNVTTVTDADITAKRIAPLDGKNNHLQPLTTKDIRKLYKTYRTDYDPEKAEAIGQYFKVELSDLKYTDVTAIFNINNTKDLTRDFIRIADIDFTRDYSGTFCKQLLTEYLIKKCGFKEQNNTPTYDENGEEVEEEHQAEQIINSKQAVANIKTNQPTTSNTNNIICKNNSSVGGNCLTFINGNVRYKVYNKFIHSVEIKSNTQQIGTNLYNWINNKEQRLRENIPKTLDHGFTRLEVTFYRNDNTIPSEEEIEEALDGLVKLLPKDIIYSTPIKEQWRAYTECIKNNVLILDRTHNNATLSYSINKQTRRITGITCSSRDKNDIQLLKTINKTDVLYLLTHCTMDVPVLIIFLDLEDTPTTDKKTGLQTTEPSAIISYKYLTIRNKDNSERTTNIFKPNCIYYTLHQATEQTGQDNQPRDAGLEDNNIVRLRIAEHDNRQGRKFYERKKYKFNNIFNAIWLETEPLTFTKPLTIQQQAEQHQEEQFIDDNKVTLKGIAAYNEEQINKQLDNQKVLEERQQLINNIKKATENGTKNLNVLPIGYIVKVAAIKQFTKYTRGTIEINGKTREQLLPNMENRYILVTCDGTTFNSYWSPPHVNKYIETLLKDGALVMDKHKLIYLTDNETIFKFTIDNINTTYKGTYANISKITAHQKLQQLIKERKTTDTQIKDIALDNHNIDPTIKEKACNKLESLEEGQELNITACTKKCTGTKTKYLFLVEGHNQPFISNSFMEDLFLKEGVPNHKFKLLTGRIKTTKTKAKLRSVLFS